LNAIVERSANYPENGQILAAAGMLTESAPAMVRIQPGPVHGNLRGRRCRIKPKLAVGVTG